VNRRIAAWTRRHRAELISAAFVVQILASPIADRDPHAGAVLALILFATLAVGVSYQVNRKVAYLALGPFCLLWLAARMLEAFAGPGHIYSHLAPAAGLGLSCAALFIIFHRFFSVSMVTRAMLAEAFVCYLIIAIAFSQLYLLLSRFVDHPFNEQIPVTQSSTFLYFSMDTLSGVGTGVIAPINPYIRLITGIENMIGIFYLAVVVSRLVSSYRSRSRQQRHQPADQPIE
jgi:Ion channel